MFFKKIRYFTIVELNEPFVSVWILAKLDQESVSHLGLPVSPRVNCVTCTRQCHSSLPEILNIVGRRMALSISFAQLQITQLTEPGAPRKELGSPCAQHWLKPSGALGGCHR